MPYVVISLIFGIGAWILPAIVFFQQKYDPSFEGLNGYLSIVSFGFCFLSIYTQILLIKSYGEKWSLITDTLNALILALPVLVIGTVVLNLLNRRTFNHSKR